MEKDAGTITAVSCTFLLQAATRRPWGQDGSVSGLGHRLRFPTPLTALPVNPADTQTRAGREQRQRGAHRER